MRVFTSCSDNYTRVFDLFHKSYCSSGLEPDSLHVHRYEMPEGANGFKTANWYHALATKMEYFRAKLAELSVDEVALFTDCDVQFFDDAPDVFSRLRGDILKRELTFLFMREGDRDEVNGGFFLARNNKFSRLVLGIVCRELKAEKPPEYGEQTVFNRLLPNSSFRWDYIPDRHVVWADNVPRGAQFQRMQIAVHHAVCSSSVQDKVLQMESVAEQVRREAGRSVERVRRAGAVQVVICREHDAGWTVPGDWLTDSAFAHETFVYDKDEFGPDPRYEQLGALVFPLMNVGGAPHGFLHHIVHNYDRLADITVFASSRSLGTWPKLPLSKYVEARTFRALISSVGHGFYGADRWAQEDNVGYGYLSDPELLQGLQRGSIQPCHMSFGEFYDALVNGQRPEEARCVTVASDLFAVTRSTVHFRPRVYYEALLSALSGAQGQELAFYYTKAWYHIFMGWHTPDWAIKPRGGYFSLTDDPEGQLSV